MYLTQRGDAPEVRERCHSPGRAVCDTGPHSHPRAAQPPLRAGVSTGASPWLGLTQDKHSAFLKAFPSVAINLRGTQLTLEQSRHPSDTPNSPQGPEGQSVPQPGWEERHCGLLRPWDLAAVSSPELPLPRCTRHPPEQRHFPGKPSP